MLYAKPALMKVTTQCSVDVLQHITQGLVFVYHKLHVHHFVIAERFKQKGVAVYCLMKTLLSTCLHCVLAPNSHRCHLYSEYHTISLFRFSIY
jgi:BarA-like signal transduction histidine kinase